MLLPPHGGRKGRIIMKLDNIFFIGYDERIKINVDMLIVNAWNAYVDIKKGEKIYFNDEEFFENSFTNKYDAALAVSLSGNWRWADRFVCFDEDGYLTSFSHWDDENSPIEIDKIDINSLINNLKNANNIPVNNIPRAIHDALKEV